jgi:hypothetical protein
MLFTLAVILVILWLLGIISSYNWALAPSLAGAGRIAVSFVGYAASRSPGPV